MLKAAVAPKTSSARLMSVVARPEPELFAWLIASSTCCAAEGPSMSAKRSAISPCAAWRPSTIPTTTTVIAMTGASASTA